MYEKIIRFIEKQTCASVCCVDEMGNPYCFSCFYSFNGEEGLLYFKSSTTSKHASVISKNPFIAGTILPDKLNRLQVKGIQFEGKVLPKDHLYAKQAPFLFHKQFPIALTMPGEIRTVLINHIKMTDNSMGFGKKISWSRNEKMAQ